MPEPAAGTFDPEASSSSASRYHVLATVMLESSAHSFRIQYDECFSQGVAAFLPQAIPRIMQVNRILDGFPPAEESFEMNSHGITATIRVHSRPFAV